MSVLHCQCSSVLIPSLTDQERVTEIQEVPQEDALEESLLTSPHHMVITHNSSENATFFPLQDILFKYSLSNEYE